MVLKGAKEELCSKPVVLVSIYMYLPDKKHQASDTSCCYKFYPLTSTNNCENFYIITDATKVIKSNSFGYVMPRLETVIPNPFMGYMIFWSFFQSKCEVEEVEVMVRWFWVVEDMNSNINKCEYYMNDLGIGHFPQHNIKMILQGAKILQPSEMKLEEMCWLRGMWLDQIECLDLSTKLSSWKLVPQTLGALETLPFPFPKPSMYGVFTYTLVDFLYVDI